MLLIVGTVRTLDEYLLGALKGEPSLLVIPPVPVVESFGTDTGANAADDDEYGTRKCRCEI
mgnify:CR=1 FL=1